MRFKEFTSHYSQELSYFEVGPACDMQDGRDTVEDTIEGAGETHFRHDKQVELKDKWREFGVSFDCLELLLRSDGSAYMISVSQSRQDCLEAHIASATSNLSCCQDVCTSNRKRRLTKTTSAIVFCFDGWDLIMGFNRSVNQLWEVEQ